MRTALPFILLLISTGPAVAAPVNAEKNLTFHISADVDAICSLAPEGIRPTVSGELKPGANYTVEQKFQYGCNSPYRLDLQATFGRMMNISASGQNIGIDYVLTFGGQTVQLDPVKLSAVLAEVKTFQSLLPLQTNTGSVSVVVPGAEGVVAGRYEERLVVTLSSIL